MAHYDRDQSAHTYEFFLTSMDRYNIKTALARNRQIQENEFKGAYDNTVNKRNGKGKGNQRTEKQSDKQSNESPDKHSDESSDKHSEENSDKHSEGNSDNIPRTLRI